MFFFSLHVHKHELVHLKVHLYETVSMLDKNCLKPYEFTVRVNMMYQPYIHCLCNCAFPGIWPVFNMLFNLSTSSSVFALAMAAYNVQYQMQVQSVISYTCTHILVHVQGIMHISKIPTDENPIRIRVCTKECYCICNLL